MFPKLDPYTLPVSRFGLLLLPLVCLLCSPAGLAERPPNLVIIFTDDQGYQDLGCFGSKDIRTPRLDEMAAQGMKLTSFYAQPICGPSRAALMTGCYPLRVAERGNIKNVHPILHSKEITIAEVLKTRGYATACFGKWDLAKHAQAGFFIDLFPTRQGFDYFYGTPTSNDSVVNLYRNEELIEPRTSMATLTRRYTDEAIAFMKKNRERPFFVYVPHTMPHTRLDASEQFKGKSSRGLYGDVIEEIDFNAGRILDAIKEMGLTESTYVLFTSDNGPWLIKNRDHADGHRPDDRGGSSGPLRSGKVSTWEGGVRVPTILWGPGRVPAGTICDSIASTLDIMPTFAALAGTKPPGDRVIDGEDIRHLFHGQFDRATPDKTFFYYLRVHLQAVRQGKWKLHLVRDREPAGAAPFSRNNHIAPADRVGFERPFLVDLDEDLGETRNVAAEHPEVVKRLLGLAEQMREDLGDHDRVGKNMRFFDPLEKRPTSPPTPPRRQPKKPASKQKAEEVLSDFRFSPAHGLGPEKGVMRRDPSDVIKVGGLYWVWYTKGAQSHGYDATVWYATSPDGRQWTEKGEALARGPRGSWDEQSVFTPNILEAEGRYWLFNTAVPRPFLNEGPNITKTAIGAAVSDSPAGPWRKLDDNPLLVAADDPKQFDSMRVDDACLVVRDGKYWLYYKGRQWDNTPRNTRMGVAIADRPHGPYAKYKGNPIVKGGHEVLVWPHGKGVVAMINIGPRDIARTLQYSRDGLKFSRWVDLKRVPSAAGAYRPEAFLDNDRGTAIQWGISIGHRRGFRPFLERYDCLWAGPATESPDKIKTD